MFERHFGHWPLGLPEALVVALTACFIAASTAAYAQDYPTKPVRLIVPAAPGGGADIAARVIAHTA